MFPLIKKSLFILFGLVIIQSCQSSNAKNEAPKPRIAIAGLAIESSTFSPAKSEIDAFLAREGEDVLKYILFRGNFSPETCCNLDSNPKGSCAPGGIVTRKAYDSLVGKTLTLLKEGMLMTVSFLTYMGQ